MNDVSRTSELERTGRLVLIGLWIDALLVMAASAWNGGRALAVLGDPFGFGILLGFAVDVGLAAALVGDRALHLAGRTEPWGRAVRVTTALMSLGLNCAVPLWLGQTGLALFHAFLPILLILLAEYAQSCTLQFQAIAAERVAAEQAERDAQLAAARSTYEADQARLKTDRDAETARLDRLRTDQARQRELATAEHEREMADRQQAREHEAQQSVAALASVLALGAAWRSRPKRPAPPSQARPARVPAGTSQSRPTPVPVTDALLSQARKVRTRQLSQGKTAGRAVLQRELGVPERTAKELARLLDEQPLHAVGGTP